MTYITIKKEDMRANVIYCYLTELQGGVYVEAKALAADGVAYAACAALDSRSIGGETVTERVIKMCRNSLDDVLNGGDGTGSARLKSPRIEQDPFEVIFL